MSNPAPRATTLKHRIPDRLDWYTLRSLAGPLLLSLMVLLLAQLLERLLRLFDMAVELRLTGINLLGRHQELANRPLQAQPEFAGRPANEVSRQAWLALETTF